MILGAHTEGVRVNDYGRLGSFAGSAVHELCRLRRQLAQKPEQKSNTSRPDDFVLALVKRTLLSWMMAEQRIHGPWQDHEADEEGGVNEDGYWVGHSSLFAEYP